jgi:hypothetical protein
MPEHLNPESFGLKPEERDDLTARSRSPHPYHHQNFELPHPADRLVYRTSVASTPTADDQNDRLVPFPAYSYSKESSPGTESGTDADDEHFLKGLPAPKTRWHKGLRGRNEPLSGTSTPLFSSTFVEEEGRKDMLELSGTNSATDGWWSPDSYRVVKVLVRRSFECGIVLSLGLMLRTNLSVQPILKVWRRGS